MLSDINVGNSHHANFLRLAAWSHTWLSVQKLSTNSLSRRLASATVNGVCVRTSPFVAAVSSLK
eukprot:6094135-Pleurochrysis_carterae.AAC.1